MILLVVPKLDKNDARFGFLHRWCEEFALRAESVVVIADVIGETDMPANARAWSCGGEKGRGWLRRLWKFWELFSFYYARSDAVLFYDAPRRVVAAAPFLLALKKMSALWYAGQITLAVRLAERFVYFVFTVSDKSFRLRSKKVIAVGHAIDIDVFRPVSDRPQSDTLRLLTVSRIAPVSDIETVIAAAAALKDILRRKWTLTIAGYPSYRRDEKYLEALEKFVDKKNLHDRVQFLWPSAPSELPRIYNEHDIFLSMSKGADTDTAVFEAMSSGLTVISAGEQYKSTLPAPYFLEHRKPAFLAHRIAELADDPWPNAALRKIAVERFDVKKGIEKMWGMLKTSKE
ncbi:MAG: glycosyltransferase [Patescibacteria group bacterium]